MSQVAKSASAFVRAFLAILVLELEDMVVRLVRTPKLVNVHGDRWTVRMSGFGHLGFLCHRRLRHGRGLSSRAFSDKVSRYGTRVLLEHITPRHGVWTTALGFAGQRVGSRPQIWNGDCRGLFHRDG